MGTTHKGSQETGRVSRRRRRLVDLSRQRTLKDTAALLGMLLELVELMHLVLGRQLLMGLLRRLMLLLQLLRLLGWLLVVAMSACLRSLALQLRTARTTELEQVQQIGSAIRIVAHVVGWRRGSRGHVKVIHGNSLGIGVECGLEKSYRLVLGALSLKVIQKARESGEGKRRRTKAKQTGRSDSERTPRERMK